MKKLYGFAIAALLAAPLFAQKPAIAAGYDLWKTIGDGETFMDFADNPIPAGFFFEGSEAFTGRVEFNGAPLATQPVNALGNTDTVVERLDTAVFNDAGMAVSRLRIKALSLVSIDPVVVDGSLWDVTVSLAETQPVTEITYYQRGEDSGVFHADLVVNVRLTFTHRVMKKLAYSMDRTVHFNRYYESDFTLAPPSEERMKARARTLVDTNGDGIAERALTLRDNLLPGLHYEVVEMQQTQAIHRTLTSTHNHPVAPPDGLTEEN